MCGPHIRKINKGEKSGGLTNINIDNTIDEIDIVIVYVILKTHRYSNSILYHNE